MAETYNPSTQRLRQEDQRLQGHLELHGEFEAALSQINEKSKIIIIIKYQPTNLVDG